MNKEKQMQGYESKQLIDELSKMPSMVIVTAYLYAVNYTVFGEDVTEKWLTATQNSCALEKAYQKGYHDAIERVNQAPKEREILRAKTREVMRKYAESENKEYKAESEE